MKVLDMIVHAIWWETANKYEEVACSNRDRLCGGLYFFGMLAVTTAFLILGITRTLSVPVIVICSVLLIAFAIPRWFITTPPEVIIRQDWIKAKNQVQLKVKFLDSDETTNMLYNTLYNQGVVYTEEGMKVVDLPLYNYHKTWVAFDSDLE